MVAPAFIAARYGWKAASPYLLFAIIAGNTRVQSNWHYRRDVLFGAAISFAVSFLITPKYINKDKSASISYDIYDGGLSFVYRF